MLVVCSGLIKYSGVLFGRTSGIAGLSKVLNKNDEY
jgi:hypothetical protein